MHASVVVLPVLVTSLHLVSTFPPYHGGMGNVANALAIELAREGEDVTILTPAYDGLNSDETREGVRIVKLASVFTVGNAALSPWILRWFFRYDIIHLHIPYIGGSEWVLAALLWRRLRRHGNKPIVIVYYHMDLVGSGLRRLLFEVYQKIIHRALSALADAVVVSSFDYARSSPIVGPWLARSHPKIVEIPIGVDAAFFQPQEKSTTLLQRWKIDPASLIILFVASIDRAHEFKGLTVLLEALSPVAQTLGSRSPVHCIIVGAGDLLSWYEDRIRAMGLEQTVHCVGEAEESALPSFYALSDVVVLPSTNRSEAFGLVLLEAMACARATIGTNLPGVRTVIQEGVTGRIVRPGDAGALAQALIDLLEDPVLRATMGERGRELVLQRYQWSTIAAEWQSLYRTLSSMYESNRLSP